MFFFKSTVFAIFAIVRSQADQSWYSFSTGLSPPGFPDPQPWLQTEAEERRWVKVSDDCSEGASFPGFLYAPPGDNPEMVVIYDVNGFIAGLHSRNSFLDQWILLDPNGIVQTIFWVKTCTLQQLTL